MFPFFPSFLTSGCYALLILKPQSVVMTTPKQMEELKSLFREIDTSHCGFISVESLSQLLTSFNEELTDWEIQDIITETIVNEEAGQVIDFENFVQFFTRNYSQRNKGGGVTTLNLTILEKQELVQAFALLDVNKDGLIHAQDMKAAFLSIGRDLPLTEIDNMIAQVGISQAGVISVEEFLKVMSS